MADQETGLLQRTMDTLQKIIDTLQRIYAIVFSPQSEWEVVANESISTKTFYKDYIIPLAAIDPVASFIGFSLVGIDGVYKMPVFAGLFMAAVSYAFALISVFTISLVIYGLMFLFDDEKTWLQAVKLAAYAYTPVWLAGLLHVVPSLELMMILASFYGLYVLYLGFKVMIESPAWQAAIYTIIVA